MTTILRVDPLSVGRVFAFMYFIMGLLFVAFLVVAPAFGGRAHPGVGFLALLPFMYALLGFLGGVISSALYNLVAPSVGGISVQLSDR